MKLYCGVFREVSVFSVEIDLGNKVGVLPEKIAGILSSEKRTICPWSMLSLYLARREDGTWPHDDGNLDVMLAGKIDDKVYKKMQVLSRLDDKDYFGENFQPGPEEVHVLVVYEEAEDLTSTKLMPPVDDGWTAEWLSEYHNSRIAPHELPLVGELIELTERELPVKIALHKQIQALWLMKMRIPSPALMDKLFRVDNVAPCVHFLYQIGSRVVDPVRPGDSEASFISFWDDLIRHVLHFVVFGKSDRHSSGSAPRGTTRPNFLFTVDSVCVFRGKEMAPGARIETARRELIENVVWSYGDAPYLFGYTAVGYQVSLYAIVRVHGAVDAIRLGAYDTEHLEGRLRLLLALLNVARLLQSLASLCRESSRDEYRTIRLDQGITILLEPSRVVKSFPTPLFDRAKAHAEVVYRVLDEHAVPNVDRLDHVDESTKRLTFKPRGRETRPGNLEELFRAVSNVLQALVGLHAASWMHRDIRWPNVIKSRDGDNSWFLIDFMDAAQSPQASPSGSHLSQAEHAPEIFSGKSHTTAVDVWSVGRLIQTCGVYDCWYDTGRERTQFVDLLMHQDPSKRPTAVAALDRLRQLEQEYLKSDGQKKRRRQE